MPVRILPACLMENAGQSGMIKPYSDCAVFLRREIERMASVTLTAPSIACGGCVRRVQLALNGRPGIIELAVKIGEAVVEFDPEMTSVVQITSVMAGAGYPVAKASL